MMVKKTDTITKADIARHLSDKLGFNKHEAEDFVKLFFETIIANLEADKDVRISSFGNFILRNKRERMGRNPKTGETAVISARRVVVFKTGQKLKKRILSNDG